MTVDALAYVIAWGLIVLGVGCLACFLAGYWVGKNGEL